MSAATKLSQPICPASPSLCIILKKLSLISTKTPLRFSPHSSNHSACHLYAISSSHPVPSAILSHFFLSLLLFSSAILPAIITPFLPVISTCPPFYTFLHHAPPLCSPQTLISFPSQDIPAIYNPAMIFINKFILLASYSLIYPMPYSPYFPVQSRNPTLPD